MLMLIGHCPVIPYQACNSCATAILSSQCIISCPTNIAYLGTSRHLCLLGSIAFVPRLPTKLSPSHFPVRPTSSTHTKSAESGVITSSYISGEAVGNHPGTARIHPPSLLCPHLRPPTTSNRYGRYSRRTTPHWLPPNLHHPTKHAFKTEWPCSSSSSSRPGHKDPVQNLKMSNPR